MTRAVYILGGHQTDFARNWTKEGKHISAMLRETVRAGLVATGVEPREVAEHGVGHVGNFAAELYAMQGHLGAFLVDVDPAFAGLPTGRHEAACASGSIALLAASAELEAGRYDVALVVGVEQMKTVSPAQGGDFLGTAAWYEREAKGVEFPFPKLFGRLGDEYDKRYGLKDEHLAAISTINYDNARKNPKAQTRTWYMSSEHACKSDPYNTVIGGRLKVTDCSQVTDGAVSLILAAEPFARKWAERRGVALASIPRLLGWGHRTAPLTFDDKMAESRGQPYVLPHTRQAILDAYRRAGLGDCWALDGIETHDCFTTSEYMAIDHFGLTAPGESWQAIADGVIALGGKLPINPSGGLIGCGHPVGATGVRQLLDAYLQTSGQAGAYQVAGARKFATLNIGGSGTTSCVFIVGT
jgi:acetyl-CoA C-acetyltransferase